MCVILIPPQQPPDHSLRAIITSARTPSRFTAFMKSSAVVRCAIANEYLRRRKQPFRDATNRARPEHHVKLLSVTFEEMPLGESQTDQVSTESPQPPDSSTAKECRAETTGVRNVALNKISTATMHRRKSNVWEPTTKCARTSSAVLVALQLNASRSAPGAATAAMPDDHDVYLEEPILNKCDTARQASQDMANHEYQILTAFCFPSSEDEYASKTSVPSPHPEESSETASPTSDTTFFEDAALCPASLLDCGEGIHAYTAHDDTLRKEMPATYVTHVREYKPTSVAKKCVRHGRHVPFDSAFDVAETPSTSLRSRTKVNDGLLLFRSNSFKEPTPNLHKSRHSHKISLNLPVNPHASQRNVAQRPQQLDIKDWTQPLAGIDVIHSATKSNVWVAKERDLEYKHRHTFIGTGSLDDFLEILEISATHITTQSAVARAFVQLASAEQLYARQCSTGSNGWDLVSRTSLTVMDVTSVDYVVQLQVKLGSITLRHFLDLISFDEADEADATRIVEAFSVASHMDATGNSGTGSRARAFRSWLVQQVKADMDH